jgi:hypothetical protein
MVGDSPPIMTLTKRWLVWVFIVMEKADKILHNHWKRGSNFFLKSWHFDFDTCFAPVDTFLYGFEF